MTHPFRFGVSGGALTDPHEFVACAVRAEELRYSAVALSDHLDDGLAPLIALTAAAAATTRIRLSTLVLANDFRNPVVLAKEIATLDQFSGGRVEWGIGAGWKTTDYERAEITLDRPGLRIGRLEKSIAVMRASFADTDGLASSAQKPHPPLLLAGGGPRVLGLAGREADIVGLNFSLASGEIGTAAGATGTPDHTDAKIEAIRTGAGDRFAQLELQTRVHMVIETEDREGTIEAMAPAFDLTPADARHMPHVLVGSIDEMCASLRDWRKRWGISYVTWSADAIDTMAPVVERLTGT
ncbi:MAG: putative F420-dependent oxidoreductase [Candidatus Aldehydirespiratoraceae bacterium]|jgi:probable F420-dependent oxidoreductase